MPCDECCDNTFDREGLLSLIYALEIVYEET